MIEVRANRMPDGGLVTTFTDITPSVEAAEALERANATLERRVRERTRELTRLNTELERAKAEADDANVSKTRFIAAASHDILQPLNAARLYVTSLIERQRAGEDAELVRNVDASLEAVEEIFAALLDISRLDTGAMKPEMTDFRIDELLRQLEVEFAPLAREKGLDLDFVPCSLAVRSDRRLLRRLLQNLVSNAIKYTPQGRVLIGCRRRGARLRIDVYDTGIGIPQAKRRAVFKEFHRLDQGAARRARPRARTVDRRAYRARAGSVKSTLKSTSAAARASPSKCRGPRRRCGRGDRAAAREIAAGQSRRNRHPLHRQRAGHPRRHGDAAWRLGLPGAHGGRPPRRAGGARRAAAPSPTGFWSTTISTAATASAPSPHSAAACGATLPAILITADRSRARARGGPRRRRPRPQQADQAGFACGR